VAKSEFREAVSAQVVRLLREERKRLGISMEVLAERAGLSQSIISLIERDLRNPTLDTLLRISEVLEVELADILAKAKQAVTAGKKKR
jgi:transcriptional regulator with XRE-family HTH domain